MLVEEKRDHPLAPQAGARPSQSLEVTCRIVIPGVRNIGTFGDEKFHEAELQERR
jgi:hypothetical protein